MLWERMYQCENFWCRVGLGAIVLTGVEAALWDLKGKLENKPVHALLGGAKHEKLPAYATGGPCNYPKDRLAEKVEYYLGLGFNGFKISAGAAVNGEFYGTWGGLESAADFEADKCAFLRERFGPDVKILIDGHMGNMPASFHPWDLETATRVLKNLEPFDLFLFEEPLPYQNASDYAELARRTSIPIAGGECLSTFTEWRPYLERDSFDVAQPDASYNGGLKEFLKVANAFEAKGKKIATHAWGAGGSLMQNIHCGFAAGNTCILEIPPDFAGLHKEVVGDSFALRDGHVLPPETPGLGIQLTDEIKQRYPFVPGAGEFNSVPGKILDS